MNTLHKAAIGILAGCMMTIPAFAEQGERVDFNATVTSVRGNNIVVRQLETGQTWVVNTRANNARYRDANGNYRNSYVGAFQVGQQVHILGVQGSGDRIRADQIDGSSAYNPYNPYQSNQSNPYSYNNPYNSNIPAGTVYINSPAQGMSVPGNFNIQGSAAPYSQVRVSVYSNRTLLPGLINLSLPGQNSETTYTGQADANGHFDVPVQANNVGYGSPIRVNVSAIGPSGMQSQIQTINLTRQ